MSLHGNRLAPITTTRVEPIVRQPPQRYIAREWSHSFCGCCDDVSECCCAYFCFPCYQCRIAKRINEPCSSTCCGGLLPMRTKIRTERKIKGTICNDFCAVYCCPLCSAVQMGLEAKETSALI